MGKIILKDVGLVLTIDAVNYDLTDHINGITLDVKKDTPECTGMGKDWRERLSGLKDWSISSLSLQQDFSAAKVDEAIYAAFMADTLTVVIKPTSGPVSATNPSFSGTCICPSYTPISGNIGDVATMSTQFVGSGLLSRLVS